MARTSARPSSSILRASVDSRSPPLPSTAAAAPMFVPGAIAATFAAAVTKVPAEAACAPRGET